VEPAQGRPHAGLIAPGLVGNAVAATGRRSCSVYS
jgi:hypothetical protein